MNYKNENLLSNIEELFQSSNVNDILQKCNLNKR